MGAGKDILTVEGLQAADGTLNPVQQALLTSLPCSAFLYSRPYHEHHGDCQHRKRTRVTKSERCFPDTCAAVRVTRMLLMRSRRPSNLVNGMVGEDVNLTMLLLGPHISAELFCLNCGIRGNLYGKKTLDRWFT